MSSLQVVKHGTGILITYKGVKLALDTGISRITTLLSHAHADHIGNLQQAKQVIATLGTIDALVARGGKPPRNPMIIQLGETFGHVGVYVTALNAGHVIGSSMFKIEFDDGMTVLYTGDFNSVNSIVHEAAEPIETSALIMEATYGTPQWVFPERKKIHEEITKVAQMHIENGNIPIFRAYSLGKAQETIALLSQKGIEVVSGNQAVDAVTEVYCRHGVPISYTSLKSNDARRALREGCAIVSSAPRFIPSNVRKLVGSSYVRDLDRRKRNYNLSGWTLGEFKNGGFPLSAHTDFPHLIKFAKSVNPKIVYCFTGNAGVLSEYLNQQGINAIPLE